MCTWWNFRMYNRRCCATEGTTDSVQQHETIRTLQYNSISLFDSPKLLRSSFPVPHTHLVYATGQTHPGLDTFFPLLCACPVSFVVAVGLGPGRGLKGTARWFYEMLDFFSGNVWIICYTLPTHCLVTDTTCIWGCLQCPLCSSWKAGFFSGDITSVQEAAHISFARLHCCFVLLSFEISFLVP